jgi:hypothetical protein
LNLSKEKKRGRQLKSFEKSSIRRQHYKLKGLIQYTAGNIEMCLKADEMIAKKSKRYEAAVICKNALIQLQTSLSRSSTSEAFDFFLNNNLSKRQYTNTRLYAKNKGSDIFPPYCDILKCKKQCYPEGINVTETKTKVPIKSLVHHSIDQLKLVIKHDVSKKFENIDEDIDQIDLVMGF